MINQPYAYMQNISLMTSKEVMQYLKISRSTLYRLMESGQLTGHKIGNVWRFPPAYVEECVNSGKTSLQGETPAC